MNIERFMQHLTRIQARNRREWQHLSAITGRSIAELDADLTAPDPKHTARETSPERRAQ